MEQADVSETLLLSDWHGPFPAETQKLALQTLEAGKLILLPQLPFQLEAGEKQFLNPATSGDTRKNISFDSSTGKISNTTLDEAATARLKAMMDRFRQMSWRFVVDLLPRYAGKLEGARTSFRPDEIEGRQYSPRHDDKRLHVDAFPSRPMRGKRILRLFTNIAADNSVRHWRVGQPFFQFAKTYLPRVKAPLPGSAWLYDTLGITKGRRSLYDHYMLGLHDGAKLDSYYQERAPKANLFLASGTTWLCFTDQVLHAALSGHGAMEQTFHLPIADMAQPETAPLRVLEKITGRELV